VGSDVIGTVQREIRIHTRRPSRIVSYRCPDSRVSVGHSASDLAPEHRLVLSVAETDSGTPLNTTLCLELRIEGSNGEEGTRSVTIPVDRISSLREGAKTQ
jgi:hypothetical protein